jgi:hypothetical protein
LSDAYFQMSESSAHDDDLQNKNELNADDVAGAQEVPPAQQQGDGDAEMAAGAPLDFDALLNGFMRLSHEEQALFANHIPAPLNAVQQHLRQNPSMQMPAQPVARPPERSLPAPEPKYDGSTNWAVHRIRVQQWLLACNTPPEQWGTRALACLTGPASAYVDSELKLRGLGYYDLQYEPERFSWPEFDSLMCSGNFGSPPTDDSVRSRLLSFQQLRSKGQFNTAQHISKVLLILNEAPHSLDDHTAIWLIPRTLYSALQQKVQLTAADKSFESLQQFLEAVRQLGPVTNREEHEVRVGQQQHHQQQQQRQTGYKRPFYAPVGPGAAANPAAGASSGSWQPGPPAAAAGGTQPHGPPQGSPQQQQRWQQQQQGPSPHVGKATFNPRLTPAEAARRKREGLCFHCEAPIGRLDNHSSNCQFRRQREAAAAAAAKRKASA